MALQMGCGLFWSLQEPKAIRLSVFAMMGSVGVELKGNAQLLSAATAMPAPAPSNLRLYTPSANQVAHAVWLGAFQMWRIGR